MRLKQAEFCLHLMKYKYLSEQIDNIYHNSGITKEIPILENTLSSYYELIVKMCDLGEDRTLVDEFVFESFLNTENPKNATADSSGIIYECDSLINLYDIISNFRKD